jgi:hypothetical protein
MNGGAVSRSLNTMMREWFHLFRFKSNAVSLFLKTDSWLRLTKEDGYYKRFKISRIN